jgi:hypothetical protein
LGWRHADVYDGDIRMPGAHTGDQLLSVAYHPGDHEPGVLEHTRDPLTEEDGVIGQQDAKA